VDAFAALADPTRRAMLDMLVAGERPAGDLVAAFPSLTQPAISRHLRVLREAGLVLATPRKQQRVYAIKPDAFAEVQAWIAKYQAFWPPRLDALGAHLDARGRSPPKER